MNLLSKISTFMFLMFWVSTTTAQNIEQIYMKSGSVVEGYIAEQKPGKYITFQTSKATIVANSDSLHYRITERTAADALSDEWREWAEENNKFIDNEGVKELELTTLQFNNITYSKVYLLEKGSLIKFLDLTPNQYTFGWGDMYRTVKSKYPKNLFTGLKETLVLHTGVNVEGHIIEQFPGKDMKMETTEGEILSFKYSQVKQIVTSKLNEKYDLWSQIQLLDKIEVEGEEMSLVGFIASRTLNKELEFVFEDGSKRVIPLDQIATYGKMPNEKYIAVYDKVLQPGEILLNSSPAYFDPLTEQDGYLVLGASVSAQMSIGETVCIEANLGNPDTSIALVKARMENIAPDKRKKKKAVYKPVITYQDLLQATLPVNREITPMGNVKITFNVEETGDYVLYIQGVEGYIVINVQ